MATFQTKVEAISGTVSGTAKLNTWLSDAVIDVTRRMIALRKDFAARFASQFTIGSAGATLATGMELFNVRRGSFPAYELDANMRYKAVNTSSMHYVTTKNPAYYKLDNKVFVLPKPATATPTKAYASYIAPATVTYSATSISNFPHELEYLVALKAAVSNLQEKMVNITFPDDIVLPVAPSLDNSYTLLTAPTAPAAATFTHVSVTLPTAPVFVAPSNTLYSTAIGTVTTQIETNEDIELASVKLQQVQESIQNYNQELQSAIADYNKENAIFQTTISKLLQEAQLTLSQESQEYQANISLYSSQVNAYSTLMNAIINDNGALVSRYSSEVNSVVGNFNAQVNKRNSQLASLGTQYKNLSEQYESAFNQYKPQAGVK